MGKKIIKVFSKPTKSVLDSLRTKFNGKIMRVRPDKISEYDHWFVEIQVKEPTIDDFF